MCKNVLIGKIYTSVNSGSYNVAKGEKRENIKMKQSFEAREIRNLSKFKSALVFSKIAGTDETSFYPTIPSASIFKCICNSQTSTLNPHYKYSVPGD